MQKEPIFLNTDRHEERISKVEESGYLKLNHMSAFPLGSYDASRVGSLPVCLAFHNIKY